MYRRSGHVFSDPKHYARREHGASGAGIGKVECGRAGATMRAVVHRNPQGNPQRRREGWYFLVYWHTLLVP